MEISAERAKARLRGMDALLPVAALAHAEQILDREQERYRVQLERYASLMRSMEQRPIRLGLYFPLLDAWRELNPGGDARTERIP